jgi:tetratricopeptide (TPR) repeat protein
MSLINDMLKDLEKRPQHMSGYSALHSFKTDISMQFQRHKPYYFIISLLLGIFVFFALLLVLHHHSKHAIKTSMPDIAQTAAPAKTETVVAVNNTTRLSSIALLVQQDTAFIRFLFNKVPQYQVSSDTANHELTITFQDTHLTATLPTIDYTGSGVENITAVDNSNNNLKLVLKLSANADVKRLELNQDGNSPELQMEINHNPAQVTAKAGSSAFPVKDAILQEPAEQQYQHALALANTEKTPDAIALLRGLLIEYPNHNKGREYLIALYLEQGNATEAEKIITDGLRINPDYPPFVKLEARLMMERGELNQAIALLEKKPPTISEFPDYHALLAALYQRTNQVSAASSLYKQLLALEPSNAKWWVGLGVALEADGNRTEAYEAFSNANTIGGLSPTLKAYLETRLNTLS